MGIQFTRRTNPQLYAQVARALPGWIEQELADVGADGVLEARKVIETSGTGRSWMGEFRDRGGTIRSGSGAGRINTGTMINALDFRIVNGGHQIGLDVGWISVFEDYFAFQDQGGDAPGYRRVNQYVQGMGVIAHLEVWTDARLTQAMDRIMERMRNAL